MYKPSFQTAEMNGTCPTSPSIVRLCLCLRLPPAPLSPPDCSLLIFTSLDYRLFVVKRVYPREISLLSQGVALLAGMVALVVRRLALMRDHWAAFKPGGGNTVDAPVATNGIPSGPRMATVTTAAAHVKSSSGASAADFCGGCGVRGGGEVMESGVFLLALEVSAMLWLVGGWSSLVALRLRC